MADPSDERAAAWLRGAAGRAPGWRDGAGALGLRGGVARWGLRDGVARWGHATVLARWGYAIERPTDQLTAWAISGQGRG